MVTMEDVRSAIDAEEPDYDRAAELLGSEALPFLEELATSDDALTASKAVSLAGMIGGQGALPIVESATRADRPEVRVTAAGAAGRLGEPGEELLLRLLDDGDQGVRRYAVKAVPARIPDRLRPTLERLRAGDADPSLRQRVASLLDRPGPG